MILLPGSLATDEQHYLWQTLRDEAKSTAPPAVAYLRYHIVSENNREKDDHCLVK